MQNLWPKTTGCFDTGEAQSFTKLQFNVSVFFHTIMAVFCEMDKFPNDINLGFRILKFMKVACSVVGKQKKKWWVKNGDVQW